MSKLEKIGEMKKNDIDVWKKSLSIIGQIFIPAVTSSVVQDPIVAQGASTFILQTLSLAQTEIKQQRVESLVFGLEELLRKHDKDFKFEESSIQETRDLLETAIINASRATSEEKIHRLRKVLKGHIISPQPIDYTSRYLDLAIRLNEEQISILKIYQETEFDLKDIRIQLSELNKILTESGKIEQKIWGEDSKSSIRQKKIFTQKKEETEKELDKLKLDFENKINIRRRFNSTFKQDEFQFLFNDMRVLGLVYNPAEGRVSNTPDVAYYYCTSLSEGFIRYLEN